MPRHSPAILICLLGQFQVFKQGQRLPLRHGGKMKALLSALALHEHQQATRDALLETLWPGMDQEHASQSLNTLVHALRRSLADALAGLPPLVRTDDGYQLNLSAGIDVDILRFDRCTEQGSRQLRMGDRAGAAATFEEGLRIYQGDLCPCGTSLNVVIERERLRALYLGALAHLTDYYYDTGDNGTALQYAHRLLQADPCREDAHRAVMRCYARLGQRAQAMKQYLLCREILLREFQAEPEPATDDLFARLRRGRPAA
ncbi:BTAD domain-containing putative transcriptional regulator [Actinoplanes sp. NPDC051513]|uniref:AfsR/SARP family transcriptional regulator n=1 Tax=Actinoplanes sp. NPDC051513 TaxID=3363908 RepID=UPI0037B98004